MDFNDAKSCMITHGQSASAAMSFLRDIPPIKLDNRKSQTAHWIYGSDPYLLGEDWPRSSVSVTDTVRRTYHRPRRAPPVATVGPPLPPSTASDQGSSQEKTTTTPFDPTATNIARTCGVDKDKACTAEEVNVKGFGVASTAVDGVVSGDYGQGSCTHTLESANPWWSLYFGRKEQVTALRIYGRADCCGDRLDGFDVRVGDDVDDLRKVIYM